MTDILVTGGTGFIGSAIVRALVARGEKVRVFDNNFRGKTDYLEGVLDKVELVKGDIRNYDQVRPAFDGIKVAFHLAYINGTENFYNNPRLVLDVGVRGQLNAIDAAEDAAIDTFVYASSSEVYQTPPMVPTPEEVPMSIPSPWNPRYSYGGGKLISELLLLHYAQKGGVRRTMFRPHNIYGPAMGFEHVIPQIVGKYHDASDGFTKSEATIQIQGTGEETRSFCFVDDAVDGILLTADKGEDGTIFHLGTEDEVSILDLVKKIGTHCGLDVNIEPGPLQPGGTPRRCPDISQLRKLGYAPEISLDEGLARTVPWYMDEFKKRAQAGN